MRCVMRLRREESVVAPRWGWGLLFRVPGASRSRFAGSLCPGLACVGPLALGLELGDRERIWWIALPSSSDR